MATITMREFLNAIINNEVTPEMKEFAQTQIDKMNNRKSSKAAIAKREANEALAAAAIEKMNVGTRYLASEVAADNGISTPKATVIMKILAEQGKVEIGEGTIKGRVVKTYTRI